MSSGINKNVNVERRTWDRETFEARARSRAAAEEGAAKSGASASATSSSLSAAADDGGAASSALKDEIDPVEEKEEFLPAQSGRAGPMGSKRAFLKSRSRRVDLEGKLGSTEIIDPAAASATRTCAVAGAGPLTPASGVSKCTDGVGWHCRVCDCFLKDSLTYLDHINGRKHQRYLGYSMRVEKSTTEEVSGVLKGLAERKRKKEGGGAPLPTSTADFEDAVRRKDEEALRRKAERARKREERRRREREEKNGSGRFEAAAEIAVERAAEEERARGGDNPAEEEEGEEEEVVEEEGIDPNLAAMMGFSGFGGSRK